MCVCGSYHHRHCFCNCCLLRIVNYGRPGQWSRSSLPAENCELVSTLWFGWMLHLTNKEVFYQLPVSLFLSLYHHQISHSLDSCVHFARTPPHTPKTTCTYFMPGPCVVILCNRKSKCGGGRLFCRWTHSHMNSLFIEKCVTFRNKYINAFGVTKSDTQKRESERKEKNTNTPTESLKLQFRIKRKIWVSALEGHSNKTWY